MSRLKTQFPMNKPTRRQFLRTCALASTALGPRVASRATATSSLTLTAATAKKAVWPVEGADPVYDVWFGGAKLMWQTYGAMPIIVGVAAATISAAIAVKWLVNYLQSHGLSLFAWYRIAVGLAMMGIVALGWIKA